jgi:hypothetical protein
MGHSPPQGSLHNRASAARADRAVRNDLGVRTVREARHTPDIAHPQAGRIDIGQERARVLGARRTRLSDSGRTPRYDAT